MRDLTLLILILILNLALADRGLIAQGVSPCPARSYEFPPDHDHSSRQMVRRVRQHQL